MESQMYLTAVALVPALVLGIYIYIKDRSDKEPLSLLMMLFGLGALMCIPAAYTEGALLPIIDKFFLNADFMAMPIIHHFVYYFVGVALVEEFFKWIALYKSTNNSTDFNSLFDGVIYAVFISLGFAAYENINYAVSYGWNTALARAVTAVPAHMFFGVFMGYYYSLYHIRKMAHDLESEYEKAGYIEIAGEPISYNRELKRSIVVPVLIHGLYDFVCTIPTFFASISFIVFLAALYFVSFRRIKNFSKRDGADINFVMHILIKKYPDLLDRLRG